MTRAMVGMALAAAVGWTAIGCESSTEEGVKSSIRSQWTQVAAAPPQVTSAAESVLNELQLQDVQARSTGVDGEASGKQADGTKVHVKIEKEGSGSEVTVTVGTLGNPELGAEIAKKIKQRAEAAGGAASTPMM